MNTDFDIQIREIVVNIYVISYEPGSPGNRTGHPDTWTEGYPFEIEWKANTDSELLNYYIDNDTEIHEDIQATLNKVILESIQNNTGNSNAD